MMTKLKIKIDRLKLMGKERDGQKVSVPKIVEFYCTSENVEQFKAEYLRQMWTWNHTCVKSYWINQNEGLYRMEVVEHEPLIDRQKLSQKHTNV